MQFKLVPILDRMEKLYQLPRTRERFEQYLFMLQGNTKDDMILPIGGYNPMGKEQVLQKLKTLIELGAEDLTEQALSVINREIAGIEHPDVEVVINLADDLGGAWTNSYTTDFSTKFDLNALVKRNFCTPYFWTSEPFTEALIIRRTKEYLYRTLYWAQNSKPLSLKNHFEQEVFVQTKLKAPGNYSDNQFKGISQFYQEHRHSEEYHLIFNFFYGDEASSSLAFTTFGIKKYEGFLYAKFVAEAKV